MTIKEIVISYLKEHGFEGLCSEDCGCDIDDLAPCESSMVECVPAMRVPCPGTDECEGGWTGPHHHYAVAPAPLLKPRPRIICMCGSTRFTDEMLLKQWQMTKKGHIVLSWCALPSSYLFQGPHVGDIEGVKELIDEVHKRKIDLADEVFVVNVGGYVGDSTKSEIEYAMLHNKPIDWLEPESGSQIMSEIEIRSCQKCPKL